MRKLFALATAVTASLAIVVGLAYAWTGFASRTYQASAGSVQVSINNDAYTGNVLLPGTNQPMVTGEITNNTGVPVAITGGSVPTITDVSGNCAGSMSGSVTGSGVIANGATGGSWTGFLALGSGASDGCQNGLVNYTVRVDVTT